MLDCRRNVQRMKPLTPHNSGSPPRSRPQRRGAAMAKVLVVDDNEDARESFADMLRCAGHEVFCAPNGREALSHVLAQLPDVVLLDLLMPEMDGPSFLEVVRSYLRIQSLPVVVLTGLADSP